MLSRFPIVAFALVSMAGRLSAQSDAGGNADIAAIENYKLTMPVLNKLARVQDDVYVKIKASPELARKFAAMGQTDDEDVHGIDDMAKKLDRIPEVKAAVVKGGFTPREYTLATLAMMRASMIAVALGMPGVDRSQLPENAVANASFVEAHPAEFARMQARSIEIEKLTRAARAERDETSGQASDTVHSPR